MDIADFRRYKASVRRQRLAAGALLAAAALLMALAWYLSGSSLSPEEEKLYARVTRAQQSITAFKKELGISTPKADDPHATGLIGLEWSPLTTTIGAPAAKRTAADARWAVITSRWLDTLGVKRGDSVVVLSSSSFPGMILNVFTALEARGVKVTMLLSLGSSTYGANDPRAAWPDIAARLRKEGLLHTAATYYSYGGDEDNGGGISGEGLQMMRDAAARYGVPLVAKKNLREMVAWKMSLIKKIDPKAVISIGGSHSSMGDDDAVLKLEPGLHLKPSPYAGDGLIGASLNAGYPVIHLLNMKELCAQNHVPFDAAPSALLYGGRSALFSLAGLFIFLAALFLYPRWKMV